MNATFLLNDIPIDFITPLLSVKKYIYIASSYAILLTEVQTRPTVHGLFSCIHAANVKQFNP